MVIVNVGFLTKTPNPKSAKEPIQYGLLRNFSANSYSEKNIIKLHNIIAVIFWFAFV